MECCTLRQHFVDENTVLLRQHFVDNNTVLWRQYFVDEMLYLGGNIL